MSDSTEATDMSLSSLLSEQTESDQITSNNLVEMSSHFKNLLDEKNRKLKELAKKHNQLFKIIILAYSSIRYTDDILDQVDYPENSVFVPLHKSIEFTRSQLSECIHSYLPNESDSDED